MNEGMRSTMMQGYHCYLIKEHQIKQRSTWKTIKTEGVRLITETEYKNIVSENTQKFFRNIGGSERATREYTEKGYLITRLTSTSPSKVDRSVYTFRF